MRRPRQPETFAFLGFTFVCGKSLRGRLMLLRLTRRDRMVAKLKAVKEELRRRRHQPIPVQGAWLAQVVSGFFNYHAMPTNARALSAFRDSVVEHWRRSLRRRNQRDFTTWERMRKLASDWQPSFRGVAWGGKLDGSQVVVGRGGRHGPQAVHRSEVQR